MKYIVKICSYFTILIGLLALAGWASGQIAFSRIVEGTIPMAPSTAVFFIILGILQIRMLYPRFRKHSRSLIFSICFVIYNYGLCVALESLWGTQWKLESFLYSYIGTEFTNNLGQFQNVRAGHMSPVTGFLFSVLSLSIAALVERKRRKQNFSSELPGYSAFLAFVIALTVLMGYLYSTPLFYGSFVIPMALPTALAFIFQSLSLFYLIGKSFFPLRLFLGHGTHVHLLRVFLPVGIGALLLQNLTIMYFKSHYQVNLAVLSIVSASIFGWLLAICIVQASRYVSHQLDKIEQDREDLSRLKSEFVNNMSHEMITPLSAIIGFSDLLKDESSPKEFQIYLGNIKDASDRLLNLVNNTLSFNMMTGGNLPILQCTPFVVRQAIENAIGKVIKTKKPEVKFNLEINGQGKSILLGNEEGFKCLIVELVGNALKFTEAGEVEVRASISDGHENCISVLFEVKDTGRGMTEAEKAHIFQPFFQGDGTLTRKSGGTGIGLAMCQRWAKAMGGQICFESQRGVGSKFWCQLQFEKERRKVPRPARTHFSVLVVEDASDNQIVIGRMLERLGCQYDVAENGLIALEKLKTVSYDLVLMDCQMPEMDGYEATRVIRKMELNTGKRIPIVACTAHANKEAYEQCLEAGMDDFITKPVRSGTLIKILDKWGGKLISSVAGAS